MSLFPGWLMGESDLLRKEYPPEKIRPNTAQAKEYLQRALQELGLSQTPTSVLLAGDNPISNIQSEWAQQNLTTEPGIDVIIYKQLLKQPLAEINSGAFVFLLPSWEADSIYPHLFGVLASSWYQQTRAQQNNTD